MSQLSSNHHDEVRLLSQVELRDLTDTQKLEYIEKISKELSLISKAEMQLAEWTKKVQLADKQFNLYKQQLKLQEWKQEDQIESLIMQKQAEGQEMEQIEQAIQVVVGNIEKDKQSFEQR